MDVKIFPTKWILLIQISGKLSTLNSLHLFFPLNGINIWHFIHSAWRLMTQRQMKSTQIWLQCFEWLKHTQKCRHTHTVHMGLNKQCFIPYVTKCFYWRAWAKLNVFLQKANKWLWVYEESMSKDRHELHNWSAHSIVTKRSLFVHFPEGGILCRGQEANRISC